MLKNLDPQDLKLHPIRNKLPRWQKDDERFQNLVEDIRENGITQAILVIEPDLVIDGDARIQAARRLQLKTVPVQVVQAEDAATVILSTLNRRHLNKSGLAYFAFPLFAPALREALARNLHRLKNGGKSPAKSISDSVGNALNAEAIATRLGISRDMLEMAGKVHKQFESSAIYEFTIQGGSRDGEVVECTLKEWFEPRLLADTTLDEHDGNRRALGLGAILKAIGSIKTYQETLKGSRPEPDQLELFVGSILAPVKKWGSYARLDPAGKKATLERFRAQLEAMSDAQREETSRAMVDIAAFYERLAKECEDAAKPGN